jgi:hypothetical protein
VKIFLDDDPIRDSWVDDTWTIVRTVPEAKRLLANNTVEILSLDHDLGDEFDGYQLCTWLEILAASGNWDVIPHTMEIHSANPVGRKNMKAAIDNIERMRNVRDSA